MLSDNVLLCRVYKKPFFTAISLFTSHCSNDSFLYLIIFWRRILVVLFVFALTMTSVSARTCTEICGQKQNWCENRCMWEPLIQRISCGMKCKRRFKRCNAKCNKQQKDLQGVSGQNMLFCHQLLLNKIFYVIFSAIFSIITILIIYLDYISFIIVSDNDTQMYETQNVIKGQ